MGNVFLHGKGGAGGGLNFKIVGGTTEPSSPSENAIWVNTDAKITSWVFGAVEPEVPSEGMVWISTSTSSGVEFNAVKKNGIQVYPVSAKQYISGAWVDVEAKSYQNGVWVDWITYYYNGENEGWASHNNTNNGGWIFGTLTFNKAMVLTTDSEVGQIVVVSDDMYDLTNTKTVTFVIDNATVFSTAKYAYVGICNAQSWPWNPGDGNVRPPSTYANAYAQIKNTGEIDVDVTAFSGKYYLFVCSIQNQTIVCSRVYQKR